MQRICNVWLLPWLIDGDPNRSATGWAKRGQMPFTVVDKEEGTFRARNFEHVVIDTEARAGQADFEILARGQDVSQLVQKLLEDWIAKHVAP